MGTSKLKTSKFLCRKNTKTKCLKARIGGTSLSPHSISHHLHQKASCNLRCRQCQLDAALASKRPPQGSMVQVDASLVEPGCHCRPFISQNGDLMSFNPLRHPFLFSH